MTVLDTRPLTAPAPPASWRRGYRFELRKLLAQWPVRLVLLTCWAGPGLVAAVVSGQHTLPTDTVFGRWMHQSGWAAPLVVLSFCGLWVLPLLSSLVVGDTFAAEDRLGTWRHLLVAVRSTRKVFLAKLLAGLTVLLTLVMGIALSSAVGGLLSAGDRPLVGLTGQPLGPGAAVVRVLLAYAVVLAPTLALAAVGLLGAVALGRSPVGLLVPVLLAFLLQLGQLLPLPPAVRASLPTAGFLAWRGLFADPVQVAPAVLAVVVGLVWAAVGTALALRLFLRRDFADVTPDGLGSAGLARAGLPLALLLATTVAAVALLPGAPQAISGSRVEASLSAAYSHLYRLQTRELHRPDVTEAQLRTSASCDRGGPRVADEGPGNDWRCLVTWHLPGATATGSAVYQLDVAADGRYVADGDGPQAVNGFFQVRTPSGDAPNPLWQFDGLVDLLHR